MISSRSNFVDKPPKYAYQNLTLFKQIFGRLKTSPRLPRIWSIKWPPSKRCLTFYFLIPSSEPHPRWKVMTTFMICLACCMELVTDQMFKRRFLFVSMKLSQFFLQTKIKSSVTFLLQNLKPFLESIFFPFFNSCLKFLIIFIDSIPAGTAAFYVAVYTRHHTTLKVFENLSSQWIVLLDWRLR